MKLASHLKMKNTVSTPPLFLLVESLDMCGEGEVTIFSMSSQGNATREILLLENIIFF